jgi:DNA polymerase III subunit epsilon
MRHARSSASDCVHHEGIRGAGHKTGALRMAPGPMPRYLRANGALLRGWQSPGPVTLAPLPLRQIGCYGPGGMTPSELREAPIVALDLETTGYSADHDRAIEISALRFEGSALVGSLQTFLNPRVPVPPRIQRLTGISDAMVRQAPLLEEIIPGLAELLEDAVLVGHNLPFSFGFLSRAAAMARLKLDPPRLCTLRLSRLVKPDLPSHRLDALVDTLGLSRGSDHRAQSHAALTAEIFHTLAGDADDDKLLSCLRMGDRLDQTRRSPELWKQLPSCPGVYILKDSRDRVLYVGKSTNLRRRVREHLRQRWHPQRRLRRELRRVSRVDVIETETELEALFVEARLIKRYQPNGNSADRLERFAAYVCVDRTKPFPVVRVVDCDGVRSGAVFGPFPSRPMLQAGLRALADTVGLCTNGDPSQCRPLVPRHCLGPCGLNDDASDYRKAVDSALALLRGDDHSLLDYLRRRRDHEADGLNFESAAMLRDRINALERLVGDERWRRDVHSVNVVLILPTDRVDHKKLVCIRASRLVGAPRVSFDAAQAEIHSILASAFESADQPDAGPNEVAEEMRLVHQWIRRAGSRYTVVDVDPGSLSDAAVSIATALRHSESTIVRP